ncbi:MAG: hypothetical protein K5651_04480, partial [Bacteroidales bacterium]|nr:hypothetical protein [Bacteroidales bacterium]
PSNIIYVGEGQEHKGLSRRCLRIAPDEIHWVRPDLELQVGQTRRVRARIRYRQPLQDATLMRRANGLFILFDVPQRGITPGQFAVWYEPVTFGKPGTFGEPAAPDAPLSSADELTGSGVIA